jgi:hypothetical protein
MKNLGRLVFSGLILSLLFAGMLYASPAFTPQRINTNVQHCHWGCCLSVSGWCVFSCIVCEDIPSQ